MNRQLRKIKKTIQPINTQPNNAEQTLIQEQKNDLENSKRIINVEKISLPSLRNIKWKTVKTETNKINQVLLYISTDNIIEFFYFDIASV